jgi:hypothetical protein
MPFRVFVALSLASALLGCSAVTVFRDGEEVNGIPFNVRVPVAHQTTKWSLRSVSITLQLKGKQNGDDFSWDIAPSPLVVPQTQPVMHEVNTLQALANAGKAEALYPQLLQVQRIGEQELAKVYAGGESAAMRLVSNTRSVETEVSTHQYSLKPRMPLVGSSQYELNLNAADGTMSKASGTVKDDTVPTIASLIPFNAFFSKALGLSDKATKALAARGPFESAAITDAKLALEVAAAEGIYTLRQRLEGACAWAGPLKIADSTKAGCVERLPTEISVAGKPPKKDKEKPGYEISGKITLPEEKK